MPIFALDEDSLDFPPPVLAEDGLLAVGGDLRTERILEAYRQGIFPWYSEEDPILWWSPDPRALLYPERMHVSRSLRRTAAKELFEIRFDSDFAGVMAACAQTPRPGQQGTWIVPEMLAAYVKLHHEGFAHSVECWQDDKLVGGLYGVSLGKAFFGESMFSHKTDASKIALGVLAAHCQAWGFHFIDCQMPTPHLERLGVKSLSRKDFLEKLAAAVAHPTRKGRWEYEPALPSFPEVSS